MIEFLVIITISTLIAFFSEETHFAVVRGRSGKIKRRRISRINYYGLYSIIILLMLFVGLRTSYNDTGSYILLFKNLKTGWEEFQGTSWILAENPGFHLCNITIKSYVSKNPQVMLLIYASLTLIPFLFFYRRWSTKLWLTVFLFGAGSTLLFSMAAIKQALAMGIGLWGVTCFLLGKRKWFVIVVSLGVLVHPYLVFYLAAFFLSDRVFSRKIMLVLIGTVFGGVFIEVFLNIATSTTELIGAEYRKNGEFDDKGMNILRFLIYCVTPTLAWIYKGKINAKNDRLTILFANFTLLGWSFLFISLFVSANIFGRMAAYFDPFMHLALTKLLVHYVSSNKRTLTITVCVVGYSSFLCYELYARGFTY